MACWSFGRALFCVPVDSCARHTVGNSSDELRWRVGRAKPDMRGDSSDESWWRVGRAKPDGRIEAVKATSRLEATRTRCLALFSFDEKVPGSAPIAPWERKNAWLRSHRVPGTQGRLAPLSSRTGSPM